MNNTLSYEEVESRLRVIVSGLLRVNPVEINFQSSMKTMRRWDSLKHMRIVLAIEEEFRFGQINIEEIVRMTNFQTLVEIVTQKLGVPKNL